MAVVLGCAACATAQETQWTWSGWGGGGFFWSAVWDPSNADTLYMGGDVNGIYKSTDRGKTWRFVNNGLQDYGVYTLAISKSDPKVLYAMTQNGIARTDNAGGLWKRLPESMNSAKKLTIRRGSTVRGIAVDPKNPKIVYAGSASGEVHKSVDAGETWTQLDFLSALPKEAAGGGVKPARGKGFLYMRYASGAGDWSKHGRVEKWVNNEDWSMYDTMTVKFLVPANAPRLTATPVLQTGADWKWQEGARVDLKPGAWQEITVDLSKIVNLNDVRMVHLPVWSNGNAFEGDIGIDEVRLSNKAGKELIIGDWETPGDLHGWRKSAAADAGFARDAFSSLAPAPNVTAPIGSVVVADTDPNLLIVCHRKLGLFRSADAGKTWTHPDTPANIANVAIHAKDAKIMYGAFASDGVWKSTDAGVTWKKLDGSCPPKHSIVEVAIDPRDPNVVHYIASGSWSGTYGLTRDGGATWTTGRRWSRDADSNRARPDETQPGDLSTPTNLAISPSNPDCLFISANWVNIMTTDGGKTWLQRDNGADITCFHDIRFAGSSIFATAMDEGLFRSDDNGKTWRCLAPTKWDPTLSGHQWRVLAFPHNGDYRLISTVSPWDTAHPNFVLLSDDGGKTFTRSRDGLPDYVPRASAMWGQGYPRALCADPKNPDILYLGIDGQPEGGKMGGGIFKSIDAGKTWKQLPNQPPSRCMFYGVAVDPTDSNRIFWGAGDQGGKLGVHGVWVSNDGGNSWDKTAVNEWVFNIETTPSGTVYAGGNNLWQSTDHGKTWKQLTKLSGRTVIGIAIDPKNENRIWCSSVTWGSDDTGSILRSTDGGKSWTDITGDIPYKKPLVLRYNSATSELWAVGPGAFKTKQ